MNKSWYTIKNKSGTAAPTISIHDEIGLWGITAADFIADVKALGDVAALTLSIHSPGGNVFDGLAIYNALAKMPAYITGKVEGLAASAASFVLMAADTIEMPEDSFLMIHQTHGGAFGNSEDLRDMADLMDKLGNQIANIYHKRTGIDMATLHDMMAEETWMNGNQAHALGFADTVTGALGIAAKATGFEKYFKAMPFEPANALPVIETIRDFEKHLRDLGHSRKQATEMAAKLNASIQRDVAQDASANELTEIGNLLKSFSIPKSIM